MNTWTLIIRDAFVIALTTYVVYFIAELVKRGFVTNYVNMNILLLLVLFLGIITVLFDKDGESSDG
jgi:uncharacterized membrane protein YqaE (UPF0057 family)